MLTKIAQEILKNSSMIEFIYSSSWGESIPVGNTQKAIHNIGIILSKLAREKIENLKKELENYDNQSNDKSVKTALVYIDEALKTATQEL